MNDTAVLVNFQTNDLYRHVQGSTFKNLRTKKEGDIPEDLANKVLIIDYNATMMINKFPIIEELIYRLKLKKEKC